MRAFSQVMDMLGTGMQIAESWDAQNAIGMQIAESWDAQNAVSAAFAFLERHL